MTDFGSDYVLGRIAVSFMKTADALRTDPAQTVIPRLNFATGGVDKNSVNSPDTPVDAPTTAEMNTPVGQGSQLLPPAAAGTAAAPGTSTTFTSEGATVPATRSNAPVVQAQPAWGEMTAQQRQDRQDVNRRNAAERSVRIKAFNANRNKRVTEAQQAKQPGVDTYNAYRNANPVDSNGFSTKMTADQKLRMGANLRANGALKPGGFQGVDDTAIDSRVADPASVYATPDARRQSAIADASMSITGTNSAGNVSRISVPNLSQPAIPGTAQQNDDQGATTTSNATPATTPVPVQSASPAEARRAQDQAAPVASAPNGLNPSLPTQQGASSTPAEAPQQGASRSPQPGVVASAPTAPKAPTAPVAPSAPTPAASKPSGSGTSSLPFQAKGKT